MIAMDDTLPLSTHLVARLTRLFDLNSLEEIKSLEECGYVKQNIDIEQDDDFEYSDIYDMEEPSKPSNQLTQLTSDHCPLNLWVTPPRMCSFQRIS